MRQRPGLCLLLLLSACASDSGPRTATELRLHARGMNVLLVFFDAANASHFSYMGYGRQTTPNIDLPAAMPTLASWAAERFPSRLAFLANGWLNEALGFQRGFTTFEETFEGVRPRQTAPANLVTDRFLAWAGDEPAGPWLSWLHYLEPHLPFSPPEPWFSKFDPEFRNSTDGTATTLSAFREKTPPPGLKRNTVALYDGNLAWVDSEFGRVVADLKRRGEWDRTIVVVTSDHGEAFWEHGVRGHGTHIYEEFVRSSSGFRSSSAYPVWPRAGSRMRSNSSISRPRSWISPVSSSPRGAPRGSLWSGR